MATAYNPNFYEQIRGGCQASAAVIVPHVLAIAAEHLGDVPLRVVDVGCGEGWFARASVEHGAASAVGIDGAYVDPIALKDSGLDLSFVQADLAKSIPAVDGNVAICLEVAEHLDPDPGAALIAYLCKFPVVVFSAAIPGQGGVDHRNEAWPAYWDRQFRALGHGVLNDPRMAFWDDDRIECWYSQNTAIYAAGATGPCPPSLVHPTLWSWRLP